MDKPDVAVLTSIERDILQPDVIAATLRKAMERLKPQTAAAQEARQGLEKQLTTVDRDLARLTAAVTAGGELDTLVAAIKEREQSREGLRLALRSLERAGKAATLDLPAVEWQLRVKLDEWRAVLRKHVPQARQVLKKLLAGPLVFTAHGEGGKRYYEFPATIAIGRIIGGLACANTVASPAGFEPAFWP